MKGQLSEAELHFLRARLRGGILAKARRGELRLPLPIGLAYDSRGQVILDPDGGCASALSLLFDTFTATGSAYAVVRAFRAGPADLPRPAPRRAARRRAVLDDAHPRPGPEDPAQPRLRRRLLLRPGPPRHRPGRAPPHPDQAGRRLDRPDPRPPPRLHHLAPIPGQPAVLAANAAARGENRTAGPAREGPALLQGLIVCGRCGRRMTVRYHTRTDGTIVPDYVCQNDGIATPRRSASTCPAPSSTPPSPT